MLERTSLPPTLLPTTERPQHSVSPAERPIAPTTDQRSEVLVFLPASAPPALPTATELSNQQQPQRAFCTGTLNWLLDSALTGQAGLEDLTE